MGKMGEFSPRALRSGRLGSVLVALALVTGVLVPVAPASAATTTTLIGFGSSDWRYYRATAAPPSNWRTSAQSWSKGAAPLGFGHAAGRHRGRAASPGRHDRSA